MNYNSVLTPLFIAFVVGAFGFAAIGWLAERLRPVIRKQLWHWHLRRQNAKVLRRIRMTSRQAADVLVNDHDRSGR